jgi:hypothetical protein
MIFAMPDTMGNRLMGYSFFGCCEYISREKVTLGYSWISAIVSHRPDRKLPPLGYPERRRQQSLPLR